MHREKIGVLWIAICLLASCSTRQPGNLTSLLWMQDSWEYQGVTLEAYHAAERGLDAALENKFWTAAIEQTDEFASLPPAIILDVDETLLRNAPFEGELYLRGLSYSPGLWDQWVSLKQAKAIPGAVRFVRTAVSKGIVPLYVTNRQCRRRKGVDSACPQEQDTIENLRKVGFPDVQHHHIFLMHENEDWEWNKSSRRAHIAESYRILMLFGDELGDFLQHEESQIPAEERAQQMKEYQEMWGTKWFIIPNPAYGKWFSDLKGPKSGLVKGFAVPRR